jgi:hypothetical protein
MYMWLLKIAFECHSYIYFNFPFNFLSRLQSIFHIASVCINTDIFNLITLYLKFHSLQHLTTWAIGFPKPLIVRGNAKYSANKTYCTYRTGYWRVWATLTDATYNIKQIRNQTTGLSPCSLLLGKIYHLVYSTQHKFRGPSPRANYTDWLTATCWPNLAPTFVDRGVSRGQRGGSPTVVKLSFLDRSRYFSFK